MSNLTIIIPARNEVYLEKTIQNILTNKRGDTNIIVILDGYVPDPQINCDSEDVTFIHYEESIGQRQAINAAANETDAKYIMKLDAHCVVAEGFDVELMKTGDELGRNVTQIPRMFNLDSEKFEPRCNGDFEEAITRAKVTDYMHIGWNDKNELRTLYYRGSEYRRLHRDNAHIEIDDIMSCMGPCFFLNRDWFLEHGGCDTSHGGWGQQGIEVACKAWLSGGRLVVNKRTWFAHWFRGSDGGFPYPISGREVANARKYSKDLWLNDKWDKAIRPFQFMLDKFNPPGWDEKSDMVETGYPYMEISYDESKLVLDLGCGTRPRRKGITNVDIRELPNVDKVMNLLDLKFEDNSVDTIISSDVIEHFGRWEIQPLLKEWFRVLKPGGKAMIQTVDIGRTIEKMDQVPEKKWMDALYGGQKYPTDFHKMGFTKKSFIKHMKDAGFETTGMKRYTLHRNPRMTIFAAKS